MPRAKPANGEIFQILKSRILSGEYPSDMPLREVELAEEFGVSRTPIREALHQLVSERLVRIIPNAGAIVGSLSWEDAREIFAIRIMLESFAAQLATSRITEEQVHYLYAILDEQRKAVQKKDIEAFTQADEAFHDVFNQNCGNQHLIELIETMNDRSKLARIRNDTFHREDGLERSLARHTAVVKALESRDPKEVGRLTWEHGNNFYAGIVQTPLTFHLFA